ncbi:hypothetical protein D9M68_942210 [compost metagenome]
MLILWRAFGRLLKNGLEHQLKRVAKEKQRRVGQRVILNTLLLDSFQQQVGCIEILAGKLQTGWHKHASEHKPHGTAKRVFTLTVFGWLGK